MGKFSIFTFLFLLTSCATHLVDNEEKVFPLDDVNWPSCQFLDQISETAILAPTARKKIFESAAKLGANRIHFEGHEYTSFQNQYTALAYKCSEGAGKDISISEYHCNQGDALSCLDLAKHYQERNDQSKVRISVCKACEMKNDSGCKYCQYFKTFEEHQKAKEEVIKKCNEGNGKECYRLSIGLYQEGDLNGALVSAQRACLHEIKGACEFQNQIMQEKIAHERNRQEALRAIIESPSSTRSAPVNPLLPALQYLNNAWGNQAPMPMPQMRPRTKCISKRVEGYPQATIETDCQ